jgi:hypothetical protein
MLAVTTDPMFWFPAPQKPDPRTVEFSRRNDDICLDPWNSAKVFFAALVPLFFISVGAAFWRRSLLVGLAAVNVASIIKIGRSFYFAGTSG